MGLSCDEGRVAPSLVVLFGGWIVRMWVLAGGRCVWRIRGKSLDDVCCDCPDEDGVDCHDGKACPDEDNADATKERKDEAECFSKITDPEDGTGKADMEDLGF